MKAMDQVDAAARASMETLAMFSAAQPNGFYRMSAHGTAELVTGVPMALMNGVFSITPEADHEEVAAFAASPNLESVAWSIQVRGEQPDPRIVRTAAAHGLEQRSTLPLMIKDLAEDDAEVSEGSTLRVRAVSGDDGDLYRTMLAAGFEGPADIFSAFTSSSIMDHVSMQGYIVESEGVPVATSFGVRVADQVGVFNIAVPPQHRRRGYGRAATAAVLRDAYLDGAHTAFLHASPMGVPLYEAMGFRMAEHWTVFSS